MQNLQNPLASFKQIAIVDDVEEFQILAQMMLQYMGYSDITTYSSALDARPHLLATPPDLLLLDNMMLDLDGLTLIRQLRSQQATAQLPIILCTAAINQLIDHEEQIRRDPHIQILAKPF